MDRISLRIGSFEFVAQLEEREAPETCGVFRSLLPFRSRLIHARWSGEAVWIPLGKSRTSQPLENHTSHPSRGEILWYPGGLSEAEILIPYGGARFASRVGQLAGNHFLTVVDGREQLAQMGQAVLWQGAHDVAFEAIA